MQYDVTTEQLYHDYHHAETEALKQYRHQLLLDRASRGDSSARTYLCVIDASRKPIGAKDD